MGDKLGYYRALADGRPDDARRAGRRSTGTAEHYAREWLNAQAAGGYVEYDAATRRFTLPPEHAVALTDATSPAYLPGFFQIALGTVHDAGQHLRGGPQRRRARLARAQHRRPRRAASGSSAPMYNAHLVGEWLPALDGVVAKLERGARVADIGCGHGASTILMAQAFPNVDVRRLGLPRGVDRGRPRSAPQEAGVADRVTLRGGPGRRASPASGYDLVTTFDALHDMGDPVGAARHVREAIAADGTWMVVEPMAGDHVEDNLNPVGRAYYGFSTLLCTPASLSQDVGLALGTQAGPAQDPRRRDGRAASPVPPRRRRPRSTRPRGPAVSAASATPDATRTPSGSH